MSRPNPDSALDAYSEELKQRGVPTKQLTLARHFLRHLLTTLRDLPQDGNGYRSAAETTLRNFPDEAGFLDIVREFFPYWSGETDPRQTSQPVAPTPANPLLAPSAASPAANHAAAVAAQQPRTFMLSMQQMEADPWSQRTLAEVERQAHQLKSLLRYADELKKAGVDEANIMARCRLIKLLLFTIRDLPQNTDSYRGGVDKLLQLFPHQERWHVFVSLAREFFYFLAGDADAASRLQKQISLAELQGLVSA
ncbi:hypothetical protein [Chitinimonas sp.]|uniref:hypothetical protein n=1 Tax=Chitinimonas sp. TaxID=1934313 RepID=UPI0035ADB60A